MTDIQDSPIFVIGLPRSGTTLMRMMLSSHPRVAIAPETNFLNSWMRIYGHLDPSRPRDFDLFWDKLTAGELFPSFGITPEGVRARIDAGGDTGFRVIFTAICREYAARTDKVRWGEKTPRHAEHLDTLRRWYPEARILYMQRDPRAVTSSILAKNWPRSSRFPHVHARRWRRSIRRVMPHAEQGHLMMVGYEDLVADGETVLRRICDFIGEDYHPDMLARSDAARYRLYPDHEESLGNLSVLKPLNPSSLYKWRNRLSPVQVAIIEHESQPEMSELGYMPEARSHVLPWRLKLLLHRMVRPLESVVKLPWKKVFTGGAATLVKRWLP